MKNHLTSLTLLTVLLLGALSASAQSSNWSYRTSVSNRNVYLWLPPSVDGNGVRGLIVASLTVAEDAFVLNPLVREAANQERLGIMYFANGGFSNPAIADTTIFNNVLNSFVSQSGYEELRNCPWLTFGMSTSGNFSRFLATWKPSRTIGHILYKSGFGNVREDGTVVDNTLRAAFAQNPEWQVPMFILNGQYEEYSGYRNTSNVEIERFTERKWQLVRDSAVFNRQRANPYLVSASCAAGEGHFDWSYRADTLVAAFIRKATQARVPANGYAKDNEIPLNIINEASGWLADTNVIAGTPRVYPFSDSVSVKGNKFWFFDQEMANMWLRYHQGQFGRAKDSVVVRATPAIPWNAGAAQYSTASSQALTNRFTLFDTLSKLGQLVKYRIIAGGGILRRNAASTADSLAPDIINLADANSTFNANRRVWISAYTEGSATTSYRDVNVSVQYNAPSSSNAIVVGIPLSPTGWRSGDTAVINSNGSRVSVIAGPGVILDNGTRIAFTRSPNNNAATIPLRIRVQGSGAQINNFKDTLINVKMYPYGIGTEMPAIFPDRANFCNGRALFRVLNPVAGITYKWYSRTGSVLSTTDSLLITSATENDTILVRAFRSANDSSVAAVAYLSIPTTFTGTVPTDNPYRTRYNPRLNHWTDSLRWDRIYNATNHGISVCNTAEENSAALQALNALVSNDGGGVIFFPPGTYPFKETFYMKTGVILRGATPTTASAKDSSFRPQSKLLFPRYIPTFEGDGTPVNTAFKHIDGDTNAFNLAIVNLDINRAAIDIHPKQYIVGSSGTAQPVDANRNVLIFGVRSNNVALPDPAVPNVTQTVPQHRWQRWSFRFAGNIDIFGAGNMIVANCRVNDEVTDSFEQPDYRYNGIGGSDCGGAPPSATVFNYTDHYGIVINRNKLQIGGVPLPVGRSGGSNDITGVAYYSYAWVTGATPEQEPYLFMPGNEMLDNWVFKTMRIGLQAAGIGLVMKGNETYDKPGKSVWLNPTGVGCQTNNSATYENRALDFSGWNVTIDSNLISCHRHRLKNTQYFTVDGEGILLQMCCGGTAVNDYKITRNVVREGYIGVYKMGDINNLLIKDNNMSGQEILVHANISAGEGTGLDRYNFLADMLIENNIGVSNLNINGNRGGKNSIIRNNTMTMTGADTNVTIPCHVDLQNNNVNVRSVRYLPVITYDTIISGTDTTLSTPEAKPTGLRTTGPCTELNMVRVALVSPDKDTILSPSVSSFVLRAKVIGGNVRSTKVRFIVNSAFVSPDDVFADADSMVSFTFNLPGSGFYNITARATDTLSRINALSPTYKITVNNPFSGAIVPDFSPSVVCKSLVANFANLTSLPEQDTLVSAEWDFTNDGTFDQTTTTLSNVSFTYPAFGNYDVRLRITVRNANRGANPIVSETITKTIRLLNPVASFTPSKTTLCAGETVNFTPSSVPNATSYEWDFNNDGTVDAVRSSATMVSNTFNAPGVSVVRLRVVTLGGCDSVITQNVTVNGIPTVDFTVSEDTICAGQTITFSANAVGGEMNFAFEPDTATNIASQMGSGASFSRTFNYTAGTFYPKMTASNNCVTYTAKDTILVYNSPAQPTVSAMSVSLGSAVLTVTPNGTTPPFSIKWYKGSDLVPAETDSSITVTEFGTYFAEISKANCATKSEGFVVGNILGVSENGVPHTLQAYPNPVENVLTLSVVNAYYGTVNCDVLGADGRLVKSSTFNKTKESEAFAMDFSTLGAGTYFVKVSFGGSTSVITVLKK